MNIAEGSADVPATKKTSWLLRIWWGIKVFLMLSAILFVIGMILRYPVYKEKERSAEVAQEIHDARLTMVDVDGSHLPPQPDPAQVDATVEGIDANANGIRDDVELAIFAKYPGAENIKLRAAELQYAKALQMYLTSVFTKETLVAAINQDERGSFCISRSIDGRPRIDATDNEWRVFEKKRNLLIDEVEKLVFNSPERSALRKEVFAKYMTSYASDNSQPCDINL